MWPSLYILASWLGYILTVNFDALGWPFVGYSALERMYIAGIKVDRGPLRLLAYSSLPSRLFIPGPPCALTRRSLTRFYPSVDLLLTIYIRDNKMPRYKRILYDRDKGMSWPSSGKHRVADVQHPNKSGGDDDDDSF